MFVEVESVDNQFIINPKSFDEDKLGKLTQNYNFPLFKLKKDAFSKKLVEDILSSIATEISKEEKDEFPYYLVFKEKAKLIYWLKYTRFLQWLNVGLFISTVLLALSDFKFISQTQDFSNEVLQ